MDFASLQVLYMRQIMEESLARRQAAKSGSKEALSGGVWYGVDYFAGSRGSSLFEELGEGAGFHGYAAEEFFAPICDPNSPTQRRIYSFRLKERKTPARSIESLQRGVSLLDCGNVCYLASYLALRDWFKDKEFDRLFDPGGSTPLILTPDHSAPLSSFSF